MNVKMKNISQAEVLVLKDQIAYQEGQVVSKTLAQNNALSITLCHDHYAADEQRGQQDGKNRQGCGVAGPQQDLSF